jgi:tRNA threonylcarbamoyladenosine biosynthesis protein TsaB
MHELTLVMEASTASASVALLQAGRVVAEMEVAMRGHDGERLMPGVVQLLASAGVTTAALDRIGCGTGPGGFTSLRIAAAIGKGLAESLGVPLWGASSLALLAAGEAAAGATDVVAILDALRGEWYAQRFQRGADGAVTAVGRHALVDRDALEAMAAGGARIVGVGGDRFDGGRPAVPVARDVVRLDEGELWHVVELDGWEPDYGRLAEAQVKWERAHGRALGSVG